jgi:hypothetical protein
MILQFFFLFIRGVVLLIHDDDPNFLERSKDRRAGTQCNLHFSLPDPPPLVISLSSAEATVKEAEVFSKSIFESRKKLRGEGDLRDKDDGLPSLVQNLFDGPKVDLCLATSCHTVKEEGRESF